MLQMAKQHAQHLAEAGVRNQMQATRVQCRRRTVQLPGFAHRTQTASMRSTLDD